MSEMRKAAPLNMFIKMLQRTIAKAGSFKHQAQFISFDEHVVEGVLKSLGLLYVHCFNRVKACRNGCRIREPHLVQMNILCCGVYRYICKNLRGRYIIRIKCALTWLSAREWVYYASPCRPWCRTRYPPGPYAHVSRISLSPHRAS